MVLRNPVVQGHHTEQCHLLRLAPAHRWLSPLRSRHTNHHASPAPSSIHTFLRNLLEGMNPAEVEKAIGDTPGWRVETLGDGTHEGQGWLLREYHGNGEATGRMIRWHPGGGRHGPNPYWRVTSPLGGKSPIIPAGPWP